MNYLSRYIQKTVRYFSPSRITFDVGDFKKTVLVIGAARSGTTWITSIINADNRYRYIFEPFHPDQCLYLNGMPDRPYLKVDLKYERYEKVCDQIFSGRVRLPWTDKFNKRYFSNQRIVKSTRMMLALGWLHKKFPDIPIIYILRHPLAVVASRMELASLYPDWRISDLDSLSSQTFLMEDYFDCFSGLKKIMMDEFQRQLLYWCISNYIALDQLTNIPHKIIYYENCLQNPIQAYWQTKYFIESYNPINDCHTCYKDQMIGFATKKNENIETKISKLSKFKFESMSGNSIQKRLSHWQEKVSSDQIRFANELLERYSLNRFYNARSVLPMDN